MAKWDAIFFPKELCIIHDCWVYELVLIWSCKYQLIRAKISFQCLHMNSTIICNIGKIHIYLHEYISLLSYINHVWILENVRAQKKLPTWWKFPDMCAFSTLIRWNLWLRLAAVRRPPRTGDAWIKLRMSVFCNWMELVSEVRCS
jgi:hypothetical protein